MRILCNEGGIGDAVLMTAVADNGAVPCVVSSRYNELLTGHPLIKPRELPIADIFGKRKLFESMLRRGQEPYYVHYWGLADAEEGVFSWQYPKVHMIAKACARAGIYGNIRAVPKVHLSDAERENGRPLKEEYIVMQSTGARWKTPGYNRWAELAGMLRKEYPIVQIGAAGDRPLPHVLDLSGRLDLRQAAAVLSNAKAFMGFISGPMHMARAVDTPAVIAFSDSEPLHFSGYTANENVLPEERCELCRENALNMFNSDPCPNDLRCTRSISTQALFAAFERLHARLGQTLVVEIVNNETERETTDPCILYLKTQLRPGPTNFIKQTA